MQIQSVLKDIAPQVFQTTNINKAKSIIFDFLTGRNINPDHKQLILSNVQSINNINSMHRYLANSLLKYEGLGVI